MNAPANSLRSRSARCIAPIAVALVALAAEANDNVTALLKIHTDRVVAKTDRHRLLGSNLALWHEAAQLFDGDLEQWMRELNPAYLRIPGGSWSDEYYWNGNGVWKDGVFDMSRLKDGYWDVDYSAYAPGFRVKGAERLPSDYHGSVDVKALHELIAREQAEPLVTVNAGTGKPELAAEWVRWANKINNYHVKHWEIGNELEGAWELGHFLPDGSRMTGEIYARRFIEFAKAMKAVDPTILVGGPAASNDTGGFMEDLLRIAGEHVDFVTFHTYPVERHLDSELEIFTQMFTVRDAMKRMRGWIKQYVPDRADRIEIGITEWNSKVVEDRDTGDLINGLWTAVWVGEMFQAGVSFANQWDLLTETATGGHGLFEFVDGRCMPKSQFWGLYLWSKFMGNDLLEVERQGPDHLFSFATRDGDVLSVLLVNASRTESVTVPMHIGAGAPRSATMATLSFREYFWHPYEHRPLHSRPPSLRALTPDQATAPVVPPFSAVVLRIPLGDGPDPLAGAAVRARSSGLDLILPAEAPADLAVEGWVIASGSTADELDEQAIAALTVDGPATVSSEPVRMAEAAGRFYLKPTGEGTLTVRAKVGERQVESSVRITAVKERAETVWDFEGDQANWAATSSFRVEADDSIRPNQRVAAVRLDGKAPAQDADTLMAFEALPNDVPKSKIGGVVFDVLVGPDFECDDAETGLGVVLQSEGAHWIPLQRITLAPLKGSWQRFEIRLPDAKYHEAMAHLYALRFQLFQPGQAKSPVRGSIYLDNVGFLVR